MPQEKYLLEAAAVAVIKIMLRECLGARVARVSSVEELRAALVEARASDETTVVHIETDPDVSVPNYYSWWDVPVAEVSDSDEVRAARADYVAKRERARPFVAPTD